MKRLFGSALLCLQILLFVFCAKAVTNNIVPGELIAGTISSPGQEDYYSFSATNGDVVTILMGTGVGANVTPQLELHAPDGQVLTNVSGTPSATIEALRLTNSGNFLIICRDEGF